MIISIGVLDEELSKISFSAFNFSQFLTAMKKMKAEIKSIIPKRVKGESTLLKETKKDAEPYEIMPAIAVPIFINIFAVAFIEIGKYLFKTAVHIPQIPA